jgi:hypothetical protein
MGNVGKLRKIETIGSNTNLSFLKNITSNKTTKEDTIVINKLHNALYIVPNVAILTKEEENRILKLEIQLNIVKAELLFKLNKEYINQINTIAKITAIV